ncbi:MAG: ABC transporter ATP-binding protein [Asgard group archaeon]|nr:ABC transporter ATP-binding protein [Asgard group archaeon]
MPFIDVTNIGKQFEDSIAIADISFTLEEGELVTLLGPSGCGKTTVLKLIAGLLQPDSGKIIVDGIDVSTIETENRNIGFVFQSYALFPHLTVAENIAFGLETRKWAKEAKIDRVKELLELVDLQGFGKRFPGELSGGEKSRVALARALAPNPNLLLLDEPLSALDVSLKESLQKAICEIQKKVKVTTIYVTHDQREAMEISDRIIILESGCVVEIGTPRELYLKPKKRFTAEFLGITNIFSGKIKIEDGKTIIETSFGKLQIGLDKKDVSESILVAIYPEQIQVSQKKQRTINEFQGEIKSISFGGARTNIILIVNKQPLEIETTHSIINDSFSKGDQVYITIPENAIRKLED